jgi:hypothetical protein
VFHLHFYRLFFRALGNDLRRLLAIEVFEMAPLTPLGGTSSRPYTVIIDVDLLTGMTLTFIQ